MNDRDVQAVAAGYDAVYASLPASASFHRLWRAHASGNDFPEGFEHISFVTLAEMRDMTDALALHEGETLLDLACGMGGPGLWIARESGAQLIGLDISTTALKAARERATRVDVRNARFVHGAFAATGLDAASVDGAMSIDALQYAPDKQAAFDEIARVLRPGGRLLLACFELDSARVNGLPVFGTDPVEDYAPLLQQAGFDVQRYDKTPGWRERVTAAYQAIIDAKERLTEELGEGAYTALSGEVTLTLQLQPYRRRVFVVARKT
jgi:ubiquinone/menaquinone biosynthesis C-methylase UbiE